MPIISERRKKKRVQLTRGMMARFGTTGAIILDLTDAGARIEHFNRLDLHRKAPFRLEWNRRSIETTAEVKSCHVHRFAADDKGATVYQSGLFFASYAGDSETLLRDMVSTIVARSIAEQVANARGVGPVMERVTPADRGYLQCTLIGGERFLKKWSRTPDQPADGFTISAAEPADHVDQLCESYLKGDEAERKLIVLLAGLSVQK